MPLPRKVWNAYARLIETDQMLKTKTKTLAVTDRESISTWLEKALDVWLEINLRNSPKYIEVLAKMNGIVVPLADELDFAITILNKRITEIILLAIQDVIFKSYLK